MRWALTEAVSVLSGFLCLHSVWKGHALGCAYLHPSFFGISLALLPLGDPGLEFYRWFWLIKNWLHKCSTWSEKHTHFTPWLLNISCYPWIFSIFLDYVCCSWRGLEPFFFSPLFFAVKLWAVLFVFLLVSLSERWWLNRIMTMMEMLTADSEHWWQRSVAGILYLEYIKSKEIIKSS